MRKITIKEVKKWVNISCVVSEITLIYNDCKTVRIDENNSKQHIQ